MLQGFLEGTLSTPPQFVTSPEVGLTPNPEAYAFNQQDKLLASWLLSTISFLFSYFTSSKSVCEIWSTANHLFVASIGAKISCSVWIGGVRDRKSGSYFDWSLVRL